MYDHRDSHTSHAGKSNSSSGCWRVLEVRGGQRRRCCDAHQFQISCIFWVRLSRPVPFSGVTCGVPHLIPLPEGGFHADFRA